MSEPARAFVIRRTWLAWTLVAFALLYFIAVTTLVVLDYHIAGVSDQTLALGGAGLFVLVALVLIPFLFRRKAPRAAPAEDAWEPAASTPVAAAPRRAVFDDEVKLTDETAQGMRVIEYSSPAKSRNRSAVYTKTHVPVTQGHVVRVETLVASASDL